MRPSDFDYHLTADRIAQCPLDRRERSKLLVWHRGTEACEHRHFEDIVGYFRDGDVLVLNDSKVLPARLRGCNHVTGGAFEILLLEPAGLNEWWAMLRPGKRARVNTRIDLLDARGRPVLAYAVVTAANAEGHRRLSFFNTPDIVTLLDEIGETPLPPYIKRGASGDERLDDRERYQTVYATSPGSVAAPTAGLHFTPTLLERIRAKGVSTAHVTLHIGAGTFAPVKAEQLSEHRMHEERYVLGEETARLVDGAKREGRRVIAVGTTSVRVLESIASRHAGRLQSECGRTDIFIHPPFRFQIVDALITNFHLPRSTLLMLVCAFADPGRASGLNPVLQAYATAIEMDYRFYSFGDAMLML